MRNPNQRFGMQSLHQDDGSGRCEYDFEDWPCTYERGEDITAEGMSLQDWIRAGEDKLKSAREIDWQATIDPIIQAAKDLGLDEMVEVLEHTLRESRGWSRDPKRLPNSIAIPTDEFVWLLREAAAAGMRHPLAPPPLQVAKHNSEGVY